jgi:hypothetical protein
MKVKQNGFGLYYQEISKIISIEPESDLLTVMRIYPKLLEFELYGSHIPLFWGTLTLTYEFNFYEDAIYIFKTRESSEIDIKYLKKQSKIERNLKKYVLEVFSRMLSELKTLK